MWNTLASTMRPSASDQNEKCARLSIASGLMKSSTTSGVINEPSRFTASSRLAV